MLLDVPAGGGSHHGDLMTTGVKDLDQYIHVDPMAAVDRKNKDLAGQSRGKVGGEEYG